MEEIIEKDYTIALLIDCENLSTDYYEIIVNELSEIGSIRYKRAYSDFSKSNVKNWVDLCVAKGISPKMAIEPVTKKNTSDISIAIDAMELLYQDENIDAFCLATSDSDFCQLAQKLKEKGKYVIIAGKEQSHICLSNSSNKFLMLDKIKNESEKNKTSKKPKPKNKENNEMIKKENSEINNNVSAPSIKELKNKIKEYIEKSKHYTDDGFAYYCEVISMLEKEYPQFNYKIYGAKGKRDFFKSTINCEYKVKKSTAYLRLKN